MSSETDAEEKEPPPAAAEATPVIVLTSKAPAGRREVPEVPPIPKPLPPHARPEGGAVRGNRRSSRSRTRGRGVEVEAGVNRYHKPSVRFAGFRRIALRDLWVLLRGFLGATMWFVGCYYVICGCSYMVCSPAILWIYYCVVCAPWLTPA